MNTRIRKFINFLNDNQVYSFESFEEELSIMNDNNEKGMLFEEYCRVLLKTELYRATEVWRPEETPINIINQLQTTSNDMGIDFIAKIDNEYYAVQCKFRSKDEMINYNGVATFLAAVSSSNKFKRIIFISNTTAVNRMLDKPHITVVMRNVLAKQDLFQLILKHCDIKIDTKIEELRECQLEAFKKLICYYNIKKVMDNCGKEGIRGRIQMACGSGKSRVAYEICGCYNVVCIIVPSLYLLNQFFRNFNCLDQKNNKKRNYVLIGSDMDYDTINNSYLISTKEDEVERKLNNYIEKEQGKQFKNKEDMIIISTYQSSQVLKNVLSKIENFEIELMIFDEAHKTAGGDVNKAFALLLKSNEELSINIRRRLFMTATERVLKNAEGDDELFSMDDEEKYGKQIYSYSMGQAIQDGVLCDYRIMMPLVDGEVKEDVLKEKYVNVSKDALKDYSADLVMCAIMIKKLFEDNEIKYLLTYHSSIKSANDFAKLLEYLDFKNAYVLSGEHKITARNNTIEQFRKTGGLIASVRIFNEGVDIPFCDSICFVNGRESKIDIIQCIGRCLRLHPEKKIATIILPLMVNDKNEVIKDNDNIFQIIRTVSENDYRVYEEIRNRQKGKGIGRLVFRNHIYQKKDVSKLDINEFVERIQMQVLGRLDIIKKLTWIQSYELLKEYIEKYNRYPTRTELYKGCILEIWVCHQRMDYNKHILSDEKIKKLLLLDNWSWNIYDTQWNKNYNALIEFIKKNNQFPKYYESYNNITVGSWVREQKKRYYKNKLSTDKIDKLNKIGIVWDLDEKHWDEVYEKLCQFIEKNKRMPYGEKDDSTLYIWCKKQIKNKINNTLSDERINKLNKLQIFWDIPCNDRTEANKINQNKWNENYELLIKYIHEKNKLPGRRGLYNGVRLGYWLNNQSDDRYKISDDKINKERKEKLEKINDLIKK